MQALKTQAPPSNPQTPADRKDPNEAALLDQNRIRRALDRAIENTPDGSPERMFYSALRSAMQRLLEGVQLPIVVQQLLTSLGPPQPIQPGMSTGIGGQAPSPLLTPQPQQQQQAPAPPMQSLGG